MVSSSSILKDAISDKKGYRVTPLGLDAFDCFGWDMPLEGKRNPDESLSNDNHFLKLRKHTQNYLFA